jgi:pilus assembly protein CpaE
MHPLKIGLVIANQALKTEVEAAFGKLAIRTKIEEIAPGDAAAFLDELARVQPDVLLIDVEAAGDSFESVVRRAKSSAAAPMVIALHHAADSGAILSAMRAGASEFLFPPIEQGLKAAIERASAERARPSSRERGRIIGFLSAKGGCGATTIACHVAVEMQKATGQDVLLADFDMHAGLIGFLMKSRTPYTILDAVRNVHRLDASYWSALVSNGHANLEVISAPAPGTAADELQAEQFQQVLRFLRTNYDWAVVDLGRSVSALSLGFINEIDELYLVGTIEMPALQQLKQVIQGCMDAGFPRSRLRLVMNRMPKRSDLGNAEVQKALGIPIYEKLPNDYPSLYEAYAEGNLLGANSELGKALGAFAWKIAGVQAKEKEKGKSRVNLSIFSI